MTLETEIEKIRKKLNELIIENKDIMEEIQPLVKWYKEMGDFLEKETN